jgi:hypothetical protein
VHLHVLALDGVYVPEGQDGALAFHPLPTPSHAQVAEVARRTAERIERILEAHGRCLDPAMHDEPALALDQPALFACYGAAAQGVALAGDRAGQPTLRLLVSRDASDKSEADTVEPVAEVRGVNVHAKQVVDGRDRKRLERLCRYITRPPIAQERLERLEDGRLRLTLKSVWRDGTHALVFEPFDLLARLCAAVPPPRFHMLRYHGVFSAHCALRPHVVPTLDDAVRRVPPLLPPAAGDQLELLGVASDAKPLTRKPWAWLLRHVFQADLHTCARCAGPMRWLEAATTPGAIARLLAKHGLGPQPPPRRAQPPPLGQLELPFVG